VATCSPKKGRILAIFFQKKGKFRQKLEAVSPFRKKEKTGTTIPDTRGYRREYRAGFLSRSPRDDWRDGRQTGRRERGCGRDEVRIAASRIGCNLRDKSFVRCGRLLVQMTQEIRAFNELSEDIFLITLSSRFACYCRVFRQTE
jgi:hypothetical protein